jgi:radical SAM protein with 4Fe4S-binding SPASM domain
LARPTGGNAEGIWPAIHGTPRSGRRLSYIRRMSSLAGPSYLQLFPTLRCNRSCGFCFARGLPAGGDMAPGDFRRLVSVAAEMGVREVDILGGEPTLLPHLPAMVGAAAGAGLSVTISSNGARPEALERLARMYPRERLRIGISLEGRPGGALHEFIMNRAPMLKAVHRRGLGLPEALRRYQVVPGIERYLIYMDAIRPEDLEQTVPFYEYLEDLREMRRLCGEISGVHCGFAAGAGAPRCPAGTTKLSVMPDGSVYPCYLLFRFGRYRLGNILTDDFRRIWQHPALGFFRARQGGMCQETGCGLLGRCRGGCPAVSLLLGGDLRAPEPRCAGLTQGVTAGCGLD